MFQNTNPVHDHDCYPNKKSLPSVREVCVEVPTDLLLQSRDWWWQNLSQPDRLRLVANYLETMSVLMESQQ